SEYGFEDGALTAERRLIVKMREVPASRRADYKSFLKTVTDEWNLYTELRSGNEPMVAAKPPDPRAAELFNQAREAFMRRDVDAAMNDLEEAVKTDPTFEQAWLTLAGVRLNMNQTREGMDALRRAVAL